MMDLTLLHVAGATVIGGGISIGTQLIVAYLKQGKNGKEEPLVTCPDDPMVRMSGCREKRVELSSWRSEVDKCLVRQKGDIEAHEKLLNKGSKDFDEIKSSLNGLNSSYLVLAERIKKDTRCPDDTSPH